MGLSIADKTPPFLGFRLRGGYSSSCRGWSPWEQGTRDATAGFSPRRPDNRGPQGPHVAEERQSRRGVRFYLPPDNHHRHPCTTRSRETPSSWHWDPMPVLPPQGQDDNPTVIAPDPTVDSCSVGVSEPTTYVKGLVEGDVSVLIDSGSNVSLISEEFKMSIPTLRKRVLNTQYMFACAVNGQLLDTLGTVALPIELGGRSYEQNVHVVWGATQDILLGFDFMRQTCVIMDVGRGLLCIGDSNIPLLRASDFIPQCCNVSMSMNATVPPFSEVIVPVQVEPPRSAGPAIDSYLGYSEPEVRDNMGLVVAHSDTGEESCTVARLLNPTDQELKLHTGSHLGVFHHVNECDILTPAEVSDFPLQAPLPDISGCP